MLRTLVRQALYLGLILSHFKQGDSVMTVMCRPGQRVTWPCSPRHEEHTYISQLSIQWRSPNNQLLCHYIKHKSFQNCTAGYAIAFSPPGNVTLTIQSIKTKDFGTHICSVSKRHEFSDYSIELVRRSDSVTSPPTSRWNQSGPTWIIILLHTLGGFVCS